MSSKILNPKGLVLFCTLAVSAMSFSAFSQETSAICADPLKKICTDTSAQRAVRDTYIAKMKSEIAQEAKTKSDPRIAEMKNRISKLRIIKRFIESYKIRNQEIMNAAKKRVVGIETVVTSKTNVDLLKSYMNQAIDQTSYTELTKIELKSVIQSIVIGNFGDFLEKSGLEDNFLAQLLNNACGSDGLVSNAFATNLNGERYVLICPGFLITLSQTADPKERFNSILQAIAHEMGHHIDNSKVRTDIYRPFLNCVAKNYIYRLNSTEEDQKFCKKKAKSLSECHNKVVDSHAGELIADAWGIKATAIHARASGYTIAETDSLLTNTWTNLCGTSDEGIHPSGDFRMSVLMRKNPDITSYLTCNNNAGMDAKPACTLEGEIIL